MSFRDLLDRALPYIQGAGVAAAFGANPALGLLAGPGLASSRERRELENREARARITRQESQNEGIDEIATLFSSGGVPLQPGQLDRPESGMGPPVSRSGHPSPMSDPRLIGMLAKVAPAQLPSLLTSGQQRTPTAIETKLSQVDAMHTAGLLDDDKWIDARLNVMGAVQSLSPLEEMNLRLASLTELETTRRMEQERIAQKDKERGVAYGLDRAGKNMKSIVKTLERLGGTALEPGLIAPDWREKGVNLWSTIERVVMRRVSALDKDIAALNMFNKETAQLLLNMAGSFAGAQGLGTITDQKLDLMGAALANEEIKPEAILGVLQGLASDLLAEQAKLQNRDEYSDWTMQEMEFVQNMADGEITWESVKGDIERTVYGTGVDYTDEAGATPPPPPEGWTRVIPPRN